MKTTVIIAYWVLSVLLVALIIMFASDTQFFRALFIGLMFVPGAVAAKKMLPTVSFKKRSEGIRNVIYICLAILIMEYLILVASYSFILSPGVLRINGRDISNPLWFSHRYLGLMHPLVITVIVSVLAIGGSIVTRWLNKDRSISIPPMAANCATRPESPSGNRSWDTRLCVFIGPSWSTATTWNRTARTPSRWARSHCPSPANTRKA